MNEKIYFKKDLQLSIVVYTIAYNITVQGEIKILNEPLLGDGLHA